jgi:hypothetical protein
MIGPIALLYFATTTLVAADTVPTFNPEAHCRQIAGTVGPVADVDGCVRDEHAARDQIVKEWAQFSPAERSSCVQLATMAGAGTYTHLLTCLELARDSQRMREPNQERTGEKRP